MGFNYFVGFNNISCYLVGFESMADFHLYFARYFYDFKSGFDMQYCCLVADTDTLDY
jgi:hypothetical protein